MSTVAGTSNTALKRRRSPRRWLGLGLVAIGAALLLATVGNFVLGLLQEHQLDEAWLHWRATNHVPARPEAPNPAWLHPVNGVDFAISVPKLHYFAAVREGVGSATLASGPGHYPEMAWPGQQGNVAVAAHNIYWIRFNDLQKGDQIILQTRWGDFRYEVTGKRIVWPDDLTVLVPTQDDRLTLTTCWPLWAGAFATQRLIITAEQVYPEPNNGGV
jgi:LPXTG-site transpeptidase (sortase) family protein